MMSLFLQDIWKVLIYSLLLGAGLPVLYAVGVRASALGSAEGVETATADTYGRGRRAFGRTVAVICFAVVLAGVALGLAYIWASGHGDQLGFGHGYPTFVPKS